MPSLHSIDLLARTRCPGARWLIGGALLATATACGGSAETLVIDAAVTARCVDGGECSVDPERVSVGHCGTGVHHDEDDGTTRIVSDLPPEDIAVVVAVRHLSGEVPAEAANGGTTRGFVIERGGRAEVVALLGPERPLYGVDDSAGIVVLDVTALTEQGEGRLVFAYRVGDLEVDEVHTVAVTGQRPVDQIGSDHVLASCCAAVDATTTAAWAIVALAVPMSRRRRRR